MVRVVGADDVKIMVSESGWPSAGNEPYTTIENAQTYNNNLKNRALSQGTPRRQSVLLDVFIFALFNEDLKAEGVERNWGNFYPDMQPVYPLWGWCGWRGESGEKISEAGEALESRCGWKRR
ncbi:hypothetical protein Syun_007401 [Stephania yunnanensis]|uniref:Glucan endo-1,3-beta-D-glucosidase n=1 Tax=Stephania yunnanensis TaxID=152371 RepID=A0AAP0KZG2_9MAGN